MLRSTLHASFSYLTPRFPHHLKLTQSNNTRGRRNLAPFDSRRLNRTGIDRGRRMGDVLDILGPLANLVPPPAVFFYTGLLRKCIKSKSSVIGSSIHVHLIKFGLEAESLVSNVLLDLYAKAGLFDECLKLFDEMPARDLISWCTLISGYVSRGFNHEAFGVFRKIHGSGLKPNHFIFSSVLKGCSASGDLELGLQVHGLVVKIGFILDAFIEIGVVGMYAKCGLLSHALKMFYEIPVKSLVSWNAMISGYARNGFLLEAVHLCQEMCQMGFVMDLVTLRVVMCAGSTLEILDLCKNLHVYSIKIGFDSDSFMVSELVKLLTKLGEVTYMSELFSSVKKPDTFLFSLLIAGYDLNDHRAEAVKLAEELLGLGLELNRGALVSILNLCLFEEEGMQIHAHILRFGHESYIAVSNALISMYTKFGNMKDANLAFIEMPVHDIISWTAVMAGHVQMFQFDEAIKIFDAFRKTEMVLDQYSVATIINACTGLQAIDQGKQIHGLALKIGIEFSDFMISSLVHLYAKCGYIGSASRFFSCMSSPHGLVPTNVMLAGYCWNSQPMKALELFSREYHLGLVPDQFSFATVLGACADLRSMEVGEQIHSCITKNGFAFSDIVVGNAIINLYVKSERLLSACKLFYGMKRWNSNSYATLMLGYIHNRGTEEALRLFYQMHLSGFCANSVALAIILRGCTNLADIELGKQIHAFVLKMGLASDAYIDNALANMYAKLRDMDGTSKRFCENSTKDGVVSDSAITGYTQDGNKERDLEVFEWMRMEEVQQDYYNTVLSIYARSHALMKGTFVHPIPGFKFDVSANAIA